MSLSKEQGNPDQKVLRDEQVANFLAAFGNSETKALTLILTRDGGLYTQSRIHRAFIEAQGPTPTWKIAIGVPFGYCEVLHDVGKVVDKGIDPELGTTAYSINTLGKERAISMSGLLLADISQSWDQSLYRLFGKTKSRSKEQSGDQKSIKRSPYTRLKIFMDLIRGQLPKRQFDLADAIEEHPSIIETHLHILAQLGLIQYDVPQVNHGYVKYSLNSDRGEDTPSISYSYRSLTPKVWSLLQEHRGEFHTNWEYLQFILKMDEGMKKYDPERLASDINRVLSDLRNKGFANVEDMDGSSHSRVSLTPDQREKLLQVVTIVNGIQEGSPAFINRGQDYAISLTQDPKQINQLLDRARKNSDQANAKSEADLANSVIRIVRTNSGLTSKEIRDILEETIRRNLSVSRIQQVLLQAERTGKLLPETRGYVKHWYTEKDQSY